MLKMTSAPIIIHIIFIFFWFFFSNSIAVQLYHNGI